MALGQRGMPRSAADLAQEIEREFAGVIVNDRLILPRERSSQIPHPVDLTPRSEG